MKNTITVTPSVFRRRHRLAAPALLDTVLVRERLTHEFTYLFIRRSSRRTGQMYILSPRESQPGQYAPCVRSTVHPASWSSSPFQDALRLSPYAPTPRIIPFTDIVRSCPLTSKSRQSRITRTRTTDNVLEECETFLLDPYLRDEDSYLSSLFLRDTVLK